MGDAPQAGGRAGTPDNRGEKRARRQRGRRDGYRISLRGGCIPDEGAVVVWGGGGRGQG